ncbi:type II toxin-antitoxin system Xre/ParS family antitoxin [Candidatus Manganitrophus noduliformans]|nr:antitoxin Xre/MbcA/ParS toxin-binding domain-containing protein [Candidatus Manganitrophus noduliformans]
METLLIKERDKQADEIFKKVFHKQLKSYTDVIEMSKEGITKASLMDFVRFLNFSPDQFARLLPITLRTIQRYSGKQRFSPTVSEHIIQLVFLVGKGIEVFGSLEKFMSWFNAPSQALGGNVPSDLVSLKTGTQMVMDELGRIEHGVYA